MARMKKPPRRDTLLLRVLAELGAGKITAGYLPATDEGCLVSGEADGRHITINEAPQTVDTVIHECLHRAYPAWSEGYVRNRTSFLMRRLTDGEVKVIYDEYQKRVYRRKR